ncbi:35564_t:CDS:2, partial [Racocetra persica]
RGCVVVKALCECKVPPPELDFQVERSHSLTCTTIMVKIGDDKYEYKVFEDSRKSVDEDDVAAMDDVESSLDEHFTKGIEANEIFNFYVAPKHTITKLYQYLIKEYYIYVKGNCQSGKTTSIITAINLLLEKSNANELPIPDLEIYVITLGVRIDIRNGKMAFWKSICKLFHAKNNEQFFFLDKRDCGANVFINPFLKKRNKAPISFIIDDFSNVFEEPVILEEPINTLQFCEVYYLERSKERYIFVQRNHKRAIRTKPNSGFDQRASMAMSTLYVYMILKWISEQSAYSDATTDSASEDGKLTKFPYLNVIDATKIVESPDLRYSLLYSLIVQRYPLVLRFRSQLIPIIITRGVQELLDKIGFLPETPHIMVMAPETYAKFGHLLEASGYIDHLNQYVRLLLNTPANLYLHGKRLLKERKYDEAEYKFKRAGAGF